MIANETRRCIECRQSTTARICSLACAVAKALHTVHTWVEAAPVPSADCYRCGRDVSRWGVACDECGTRACWTCAGGRR